MLEEIRPVEVASSALPRQDLLARICVRPPYYALHNERFTETIFSAEAVAELPQGLALGPMRPGDISRHGAIAGSCAVALTQRDSLRRFYLATKATYQGFLSEAPYGSPVQFSAAVKDMDKRKARAEIHAYVGAGLLATLEVEYSILSVTLFERLNAERRRTTSKLEHLKPVGEYPVRWQGKRASK